MYIFLCMTYILPIKINYLPNVNVLHNIHMINEMFLNNNFVNTYNILLVNYFNIKY